MTRLSRGMLRAFAIIRQQAWKWHNNPELTEKLGANPRSVRRYTRELARRGLVHEQKLAEGFSYRAATVPQETIADILAAGEAYEIAM